MSVRDGLKRVVQSAVQTAGLTGLTTLERIQTGVAFNPLAKGVLEDPYPQYRRLLSRDPIHRSRLVDGWVLTRYADINDPGNRGEYSIGRFIGIKGDVGISYRCSCIRAHYNLDQHCVVTIRDALAINID